jgi:hypothetical protein
VALLIRKIKKRRWDRPDIPAGTTEPPVPAEPVGDFSTIENEISVWQIEEDKTNLARVITALSGANTTAVSHLDYAIFDSQIVSDLSLEIKVTTGDSPDDEVNSKWHRDIVVGTADNLCKLVQGVYKKCGKERVPATDIRANLKGALQAGQIASGRLTEKLKQELEG